MIKSVVLFFIVLLYNNCFAQDNVVSLTSEWNKVDSLITICSIDKDVAVEKLFILSSKLKKILSKDPKINKAEFSFPLQNYGLIDSIRFFKNGLDYIDEDYDYFQGSNSIGHPAHDIIIDDKNKDLNDDLTGKPVDVVSICDGIVISVNTSWLPGSLLRGGRYVKIFDPFRNGFYYFSHLSQVNVFPGTILKSGDKIGEVGRTGRRAILKEGSTHLHIGFLRLNDGYPEPEDIISDLRRSYDKLKLARTR